jgi:hypothetical protein
LQIAFAQLQGQPVGGLAKPIALEGGRRPQRGIEGDVLRLAAGRAGLDIAPALALGARVRALSSPLAGDLVELGIELLRLEGVADFDGPARPFVVCGR